MPLGNREAAAAPDAAKISQPAAFQTPLAVIAALSTTLARPLA